jgi:hypothetical protein
MAVGLLILATLIGASTQVARGTDSKALGQMAGDAAVGSPDDVMTHHPTRIPRPTRTHRPTRTATLTYTPTASATPTATQTEAGLPTQTATASPTGTPTDTDTPSPSPKATTSPTPIGTATASTTATPTGTVTPTPDDRFGFTNTNSDPATPVSLLGITWWYSYDVASPGSPGSPGTQVAEVKLGSIGSTPIPVPTIQAAAKQYPGGYWIIGNEPNVPGPALVSSDFYAEQLQYYASAIKSADPSAQIVGRSVLNWSATCTGCATPFTSGESFTAGIRTSWANLYGGEPPIDVWALHAYPITWNSLPMTNALLVEQQITGISSYLATIPEQANKPIWLTEYGVLWGYDGIQEVSSGCASAPACYAPVGSFNSTAVTNYLTTLIPWMQTSGARYRLQRWFLYSTVGTAEAFATTYPGISLLDNSGTTLTTFGELYRQYANGQSVQRSSPTRPTPRSSASESPTQ